VSEKELFSGPTEERGGGPWTCTDVAPLILLYACDELSAHERAAVQAHEIICPNCAAALAREQKLHQMIGESGQAADELDPAGVLLSQCRSELAELLDDLDTSKGSPWRRLPATLRGTRPVAWLSQSFVAHPAICTAALVLAGAGLGSYLPRLVPQHNSTGARPVMTVSGMRGITEQELANMGVAGINFGPSPGGMGPGTVELRLTAEKPMVIEGSLDDSEVRRVLTYVVANSQRFDEGVRLDSLDALRAHTADGQVRQVLCTAARKDRNPAVRLRALEALRDGTMDETVRETLLEALVNDNNPGVRVEAISSLVNSLQKSGEAALDPNAEHVMHVLENLTRKDPNSYVRMQSAAALRQLGPRELH
jgi:hypothetical protein